MTVNAEDVVMRGQPEDVTVVPRMQIARWLRRRLGQLTDDEIEGIYELARRAAIWHVKG